MTAVGILVNPWAGKDVRRLNAPVGHAPDTAKVGIARRLAIAALASGAETVYVGRDAGRIAERAVAGVSGAVLVDGPGTGSALDTRRGAGQLFELGCRPIIVLGGDGTCRDVAIGAPEATLVAISTGTNNVFPAFVDASSAGAAAGLLASGAIDPLHVARRAKRLVIDVEGVAERSTGDAGVVDVALVDVALIDAGHTGARAVLRPESLRLVVAAISTPAATGLASIAGRVHPLGRHDDGAVVVRFGGGLRRVRAPIVPGAFAELAVADVELLGDGGSIEFDGPGVLAYDGERDCVLSAAAHVRVTVSRSGPEIVDVLATLDCAARQRLFDVRLVGDERGEH